LTSHQDNFAIPAFPHALVKIPAKLLADVIAKTTFAIHWKNPATRWMAPYWSWNRGPIIMVATDGHRLAMVEKDRSSL